MSAGSMGNMQQLAVGPHPAAAAPPLAPALPWRLTRLRSASTVLSLPAAANTPSYTLGVHTPLGDAELASPTFGTSAAAALRRLRGDGAAAAAASAFATTPHAASPLARGGAAATWGPHPLRGAPAGPSSAQPHLPAAPARRQLSASLPGSALAWRGLHLATPSAHHAALLQPPHWEALDAELAEGEAVWGPEPGAAHGLVGRTASPFSAAAGGVAGPPPVSALLRPLRPVPEAGGPHAAQDGGSHPVAWHRHHRHEEGGPRSSVACGGEGALYADGAVRPRQSLDLSRMPSSSAASSPPSHQRRRHRHAGHAGDAPQGCSPPSSSSSCSTAEADDAPRSSSSSLPSSALSASLAHTPPDTRSGQQKQPQASSPLDSADDPLMLSLALPLPLGGAEPWQDEGAQAAAGKGKEEKEAEDDEDAGMRLRRCASVPVWLGCSVLRHGAAAAQQGGGPPGAALLLHAHCQAAAPAHLGGPHAAPAAAWLEAQRQHQHGWALGHDELCLPVTPHHHGGGIPNLTVQHVGPHWPINAPVPPPPPRQPSPAGGTLLLSPRSHQLLLGSPSCCASPPPPVRATEQRAAAGGPQQAPHSVRPLRARPQHWQGSTAVALALLRRQVQGPGVGDEAPGSPLLHALCSLWGEGALLGGCASPLGGGAGGSKGGPDVEQSPTAGSGGAAVGQGRPAQDDETWQRQQQQQRRRQLVLG